MKVNYYLVRKMNWTFLVLFGAESAELRIERNHLSISFPEHVHV
jgi:hypothetical protein